MNLDLPSSQSSKDCSLKEETSSRFLLALEGKNHQSSLPVWIMRQAGRYLPSYQKIRASYSLEEMFRSVELIEQITKLPVEQFPIDAAILFADILHIALPLGLDVRFPKIGGPLLSPAIQSPLDLALLSPVSVEEALFFIPRGIERLKKSLQVPLIGFCGGPMTIAHYILGKECKRWLYQYPESLHELLKKITQASISYLKMQEKAGVDALQVFDSWVHLLSKEQFFLFARPYLQEILSACEKPVILFARTPAPLDELFSLHPRAISIDWHHSLRELKIPESMALQGNFDPYLLFAPPSVIKKETRKTLGALRENPSLAKRFIVNLGHGILPNTPVSGVEVFLETVHAYPWI